MTQKIYNSITATRCWWWCVVNLLSILTVLAAISLGVLNTLSQKPKTLDNTFGLHFADIASILVLIWLFASFYSHIRYPQTRWLVISRPILPRTLAFSGLVVFSYVIMGALLYLMTFTPNSSQFFLPFSLIQNLVLPFTLAPSVFWGARAWGGDSPTHKTASWNWVTRCLLCAFSVTLIPTFWYFLMFVFGSTGALHLEDGTKWFPLGIMDFEHSNIGTFVVVTVFSYLFIFIMGYFLQAVSTRRDLLRGDPVSGLVHVLSCEQL